MQITGCSALFGVVAHHVIGGPVRGNCFSGLGFLMSARNVVGVRSLEVRQSRRPEPAQRLSGGPPFRAGPFRPIYSDMRRVAAVSEKQEKAAIDEELLQKWEAAVRPARTYSKVWNYAFFVGIACFAVALLLPDGFDGWAILLLLFGVAPVALYTSVKLVESAFYIGACRCPQCKRMKPGIFWKLAIQNRWRCPRCGWRHKVE